MTDKLTHTRIGRVISAKQKMTRKVEFKWARRHELYGKVVQKRTVVKMHDADDKSGEGDLVEIRQCRPVSKDKTWELIKIVEKSS